MLESPERHNFPLVKSKAGITLATPLNLLGYSADFLQQRDHSKDPQYLSRENSWVRCLFGCSSDQISV
jgi:hypothetical protein